MAFADDVSYLLGRAIPDALDPVVRHAVGGALPRLGEGGRYRVAHTGRFSNHVAPDLLAFGRNQRLDGGLVLVDQDVVRTLYFRGGRVVGAESSVIFERLGRVLQRAGVVDAQSAAVLVEAEEGRGLAAAAAMIPAEAARWGIEQRVWEIVAALFFSRDGHFLIVEGTPDLGTLPLLDLAPMDLSLEGLRRYDEWRRGTHGVPVPQRRAPETRPPTLPKSLAVPSPGAGAPSAADEFLAQLRAP
jgi:hypothetical protein